MTHHHKHGHDHHHHADAASSLTVVEKAVKMLEHWIRHNDDHATSYREWADKLKAENMGHVSEIISEAAEISEKINEKFQQAADLIREKS